MESINTKRKRAEDTQGDTIFNKSHKRHHSDHPPLLSIEAKPSNTSKTSLVKKVAKQKKASGKAPGSSADRAPAVKPTKAGPSKKIAQKQKRSSSELSSLDEGDISIADPIDADADAASTPPSEEASGEGDGSEDGSEDEEDHEDEDEDSLIGHFFTDEENEEGEESEDEDEGTRAARLEAEAEAQVRFQKNRLASDPESATSSDSSMEWASDAIFDSDGEPHLDNQKKKIFKSDDPNPFASSMKGILGYKLTRTQRANPILARSADAKEADKTLLDLKLEKKARAEMRREKVEKGGWNIATNDLLREIHGEGARDMIGSTFNLDDVAEMGSVFAYQQREKELRKTAEKGVVKMFNAFTHVREKTVEAQGMVGSRAKKEEKATKMTKEGWLEYVGLGGKGNIEKKDELEKKGKGEEA